MTFQGNIIHCSSGRLRFQLTSGSVAVDSMLDVFEHHAEVEAKDLKLSYNRRSKRYLATYRRSKAVERALIDTFHLIPRAKREKTVLDVRLEQQFSPIKKLESPLPIKLLTCETINFLLSKILVPPGFRPYWTLLQITPFVIRGLKSIRNKQLNADTLDGVALAAAYLSKDYATASAVAFLLRIGGILEDATQEKARESISHFFKPSCNTAWIEKEGEPKQIPYNQLACGDLVIVESGSQIPVDGRVVNGDAVVNQSSLTGEPLPVAKREGHLVYAGTALEEGRLLVKAEKVGEDTRCANIVRIIEVAEANKGELQTQAARLADKIAPITFLLSGLVLVFTKDLTKAISVLMVDYSCAIKLSAPLAVNAAMVEATGHGVLIKGGKHIENLAHVDTIVFDKTGTLTIAKPRVVDVITFGDFTRDEVLRDAACLEEHFPHPVASAIVAKAEDEKLKHDEKHSKVEYIVAHGIASNLCGKRILVGSQHFVNEDEKIDISIAKDVADSAADDGLSVLYVTIGDETAGIIIIDNPICPNAVRTVQALKNMGFDNLLMMTGDNERSARAIASKLGISQVHAQMLPDDKVDLIKSLQQQGRRIAMVGDGVNDSAAISCADVGVSLDHGADLAQQASDLVLLNGHLEGLPDIRLISELTLQRTRNNFVFIVASNTLFMAMGLFGNAPAALLAFLHNVSTVATSLSSLRPYLKDTGAGSVTKETRND